MKSIEIIIKSEAYFLAVQSIEVFPSN